MLSFFLIQLMKNEKERNNNCFHSYWNFVGILKAKHKLWIAPMSFNKLMLFLNLIYMYIYKNLIHLLIFYIFIIIFKNIIYFYNEIIFIIINFFFK